MRANKVGALVILAVLLALVCLASPLAGANPPADAPPDERGVQVAAAVSPLLQYQGRLLDPPTGEPVADGEYSMTFSIYDLESGGTALWTEIKAVEVGNGLFNTVLGEMVVLDQTIFNGQALWLGVKVGTDAEAAPRQPILPVAYALGLVPGAVINGDDISSGTVAETRIDAVMARDAEVTSAVSGHAGDPDAHHSRYTNSEALSAVLDSDGIGSTLDADLLDGQDSSAFAGASHEHNELYYTEGESDDRFLNAAGPDGMSGSSDGPILEVTQSGAGVGGHFASASGPALFADGAIASSADSLWWYDANGMVAASVDTVGSFVMKHLWKGGVMLDCSVIGEDYFVLPLDVPGVLFGQGVRVEDFTVYYRTSNASTFIDFTKVHVSTGAGDSDYEEIAAEYTDQTSTTATSYSVPVYAAGGYWLSGTYGNLLAMFDLQCGHTDHNIYISGMGLQLGHSD